MHERKPRDAKMHARKHQPSKSARRSWEAGIAPLVFLLGAALLSSCGTEAPPSSTSSGAKGEAQHSTQSAQAQESRESPARRATERVPTRPSAPPPPDSLSVPEGMVFVPGGRTRIGVTDRELADVRRNPRHSRGGVRNVWGPESQPSFVASVDPFLLDKHPVTVAAFRRFVEATDYETQAERFGNAGVLRPKAGRWQLVKGADWRHPRGPNAPAAKADHPVTQVSWNDAQAYCQWRDARLPTEVEWEHAARGARNRRTACPWGKCPRGAVKEDSAHPANTWQGRFPARNTAADGYRYTSPVGAFGESELGLTDMGGNVWEWTSSRFRPYPKHDTSAGSPSQGERVQRGGSFQCNECGGYHVFARSHATPETSLFHVGVRCAKDSSSGGAAQ
jgi:sulfatase modifying factor 1